MLRRLARLATTTAILAWGPLAAQSDTLRDALVGAYNHSGLLEQNRALLRAADEGVAATVAALQPILNWSSSLTQSNTNSLGATTGLNQSSYGLTATIALSAEMLLWDGGRTKLGVEEAKEDVLATRQQLISIEQQVLIGAVNAYFNVRRQSQNVALRENNLRVIREELRAAQDRFDVGEVTRTDVAQAEARLAEARSGLAEAKGSLAREQEAYAAAVGRMPGKLAAPGNLPRIEPSVENAKKLAVRNHPDLKQIQHQVASAEIAVERARRAVNPTVNLEGRLSQQETFNSNSFTENASIGISVTGPIYRGGALDSATRRAIANRDSRRGNLHRVRHAVRQNVGTAYAQLQVAQAQLEATRERIRAARVAFEGVREEATLGARTTLDVLDAEQALLAAEADRISAQADRYIAAYQVLQSLGRLTAKDLGLGVQQYDPNAYFDLVKTAPVAISKQGEKLDRVLKSLQKN